MASFDTDWDIEYYRNDFESEEHWNLRKRFMEIHKDKFPEDELVCLAQVFTNVEFMGCKYPDETMRLVGELSQEVAAEFRKNRSSRLKRTFVKASDAAEARAKGKRTQQTHYPSNKLSSETNSEHKKETNYFTHQSSNNFFDGLKYGQLILFKTSSKLQDIKISCVRSKIEIKEKITESGLEKKFEFLIDGKTLASATDPNSKNAKNAAIEKAFLELETECYSIKENTDYEKVQIKKEGPIIGVNDSASVKELDSSNVGFKMMKKQGWIGGGLGSNNTGIENALDMSVAGGCNRKGLGYNEVTINKSWLKTYLEDYQKSDDIRDLYFDADFSKDEREAMHVVIGQLSGLAKHSVKSGENRCLTVKKKISPEHILSQVLYQKHPEYMKKFEVGVPAIKADLFPDQPKPK